MLNFKCIKVLPIVNIWVFSNSGSSIFNMDSSLTAAIVYNCPDIRVTITKE